MLDGAAFMGKEGFQGACPRQKFCPVHQKHEGLDRRRSFGLK